jgi:putative PIN family toxin of toxin-antitoxin system
MRITIDTAILVRANVKARGPARELVQVIMSSGSQLVVSPYVLQEVQRVLDYPRLQAIYNLTSGDIWEHVRFLESISELVEPADGPPIVLNDPKDDPIIYTAIAGQVDVLCTVDKHFYEPNVLAFCSRHRIQLMTDVELLHVLRRTFWG